MIKTIFKDMTNKGIIAIILLFFSIGFIVGHHGGRSKAPTQTTEIKIKQVKTKNGGTINLDTSTEQDQDNSKTKKKRKFLGIF